jgi:5'-methylthioinosine phosphorylase
MTTAVIGGSGFGRLVDFRISEEHSPDTPYGDPSSVVLQGDIAGHQILFLARHGDDHSIPPHRVNYRANIHALRSMGVSRIVALLAVGGIDKAYSPGTLALPDQLIDYTWGREATFFDGALESGIDLEGRVRHAEFTEPFCQSMRVAGMDVARESGIDVIDGGTYGVTQGPRFETAAEIRRMAQDGAHIVGMTAMPEAGLAREAGIGYVGVAMTVNYAAGVVPAAIDHETIDAAFKSASESVYRLLPALLRSVSDVECDVPDLIQV